MFLGLWEHEVRNNPRHHGAKHLLTPISYHVLNVSHDSRHRNGFSAFFIGIFASFFAFFIGSFTFSLSRRLCSSWPPLHSPASTCAESAGSFRASPAKPVDRFNLAVKSGRCFLQTPAFPGRSATPRSRQRPGVPRRAP